MAISVTCSCGKELKAKDDAAGKRVRCPGCQSLVRVPAAAEAPRLESASQPQPVKAPSTAKKKPRAWLALAVAGIAAVASIPFILPRRPDAHPANAPTFEQAALVSGRPIAEAPAHDPPKDDRRLKALLTKVDLAYADDEDRIVRLVKLMIAEVKKLGQTLTSEEALEGSLRWPMPGYFSRENKSEFKEYFTLYLGTRTSQKLSHLQTMRQIHILARAVDFRSKEPADSETEAAFIAASPGCQLAIAEARRPIPGNDPVAEYYGEINREVARAYGMAEKEAAPAVALVVVELANIDENTAPDEILLAARSWTRLSDGGDVRLDAFLKLYMAIRQQKKETPRRTPPWGEPGVSRFGLER